MSVEQLLAEQEEGGGGGGGEAKPAASGILFPLLTTLEIDSQISNTVTYRWSASPCVCMYVWHITILGIHNVACTYIHIGTQLQFKSFVEYYIHMPVESV